MTDGDPLSVALACAARGWHVFPCKASKAPMTKNGFLDATTDVAKITEWWTKRPKALIGVATGASKLVVVDVDVKGEADGYEGWATLRGEDAAVEDTTLVETPSGGLHAYYQANGHRVANSASRLAPGVDVRAEGGYVIAAGSPGYEYVDGHGPERLSALPAVLVPKLVFTTTKPPVVPPEALTIPEGRRDSALASLAGTMRRQGMDPAAIAAALLAENTAHCQPPLPEKDVLRIAKSIGRYEPTQPAATTHTSSCGGADVYTDRGNAARFAAAEAGQALAVTGLGWLTYSSGVFTDATSPLTQKAHRVVDQIYTEAKDCTDEKVAKDVLRWAKTSSSLRGVTALLALAQDEPGMQASTRDFDRDGALLCCPDGVLDLNVPTLIDHSPQYRMTKRTGAAWLAGTPCPTWQHHLERVFEGDAELIGFMQRWAGRALSGLEPTDNCRILLAYGTGANGKSVTVETLAAVLGSYAVSTDFQTWCTGSTAGGEVPHPELARLAGARLVRSTESGHTHRLDESVLKLYTGGEEVTPRLLYQSKPVAYRPQFSLLLSTNHLPRLEGSDIGFWRRFLKVGFEYTIPQHEQDQQIMRKLARERAGIFDWMVKGYAMWREQGLNPPVSVLIGTAEYRDDIDVIGQFIAENMVPQPGSTLFMKNDVYVAYMAWCAGTGTKPMSINTLSQRLREHGVVLARDTGTRRSVVQGMAMYQQRTSVLGIPL